LVTVFHLGLLAIGSVGGGTFIWIVFKNQMRKKREL
jgi:hypothetical protein